MDGLSFSKTSNIRNNMKIYGRNFKVTTQCFFKLEVDEPVILILCPPWGGTSYQEGGEFDLERDMSPSFYEIMRKALSVSENLVIQLPKNIRVSQVVSIFGRVQEELGVKLRRFCLEIEQMYVKEKLD